MANSKEGQDHKDKYFDTSRKILSQEMTMCNMEALVSYFSEVMTNVKFFYLKLVKSQDLKIKYLQKHLTTRDIHVKFQSSSTHYFKIISKVKVFKKLVKLQGQGHRVKNNGTHEKKVLTKGILMGNIKALAPTVQKL